MRHRSIEDVCRNLLIAEDPHRFVVLINCGDGAVFVPGYRYADVRKIGTLQNLEGCRIDPAGCAILMAGEEAHGFVNRSSKTRWNAQDLLLDLAAEVPDHQAVLANPGPLPADGPETHETPNGEKKGGGGEHVLLPLVFLIRRGSWIGAGGQATPSEDGIRDGAHRLADQAVFFPGGTLPPSDANAQLKPFGIQFIYAL